MDYKKTPFLKIRMTQGRSIYWKFPIGFHGLNSTARNHLIESAIKFRPWLTASPSSGPKKRKAAK